MQLLRLLLQLVQMQREEGGSSCCCDLAFAAGEGDESGLNKIGGLLHFCDLCWLFQLDEV